MLSTFPFFNFGVVLIAPGNPIVPCTSTAGTCQQGTGPCPCALWPRAFHVCLPHHLCFPPSSDGGTAHCLGQYRGLHCWLLQHSHGRLFRKIFFCCLVQPLPSLETWPQTPEAELGLGGIWARTCCTLNGTSLTTPPPAWMPVSLLCALPKSFGATRVP